MPLAVNSPGWESGLLDQFINKSDRTPDPQGRGFYTFNRPQDEEETILPPDEHTRQSLLPNVLGGSNQTGPYNMLMRIIESENKNDTTSYNSQPIHGYTDPALLDEIRSWIQRGGSQKRPF